MNEPVPPVKEPGRGSTLGWIVLMLFAVTVLSCGGLLVSNWVSNTVDVALGRPTRTPEPTRTPRPTATGTETPEPTGTATETGTPAPTETHTETPEPTGTATETNTPEPTATPTETETPAPTPTNTETSEPAATQTDTPEPTRTPRPTATPKPEPGSGPVIPGTALIDVKLNLEQRGMECGELTEGERFYSYFCTRDIEIGQLTVEGYSRTLGELDFINASAVQYLETPRLDLAEPFLTFVASFVWDCSDEAQAWVAAELPGVFAGGGEVKAEFCGVQYSLFGPPAALNLQIGGLPDQ